MYSQSSRYSIPSQNYHAVLKLFISPNQLWGDGLAFVSLCILVAWYVSGIWLKIFFFFGFPCGSASKETACNAGDLGSIPGLGRSPGEGKGYPLQYSGLENSMVWIVHGVTKSWTWLSDFHFIHFFNWRITALQNFVVFCQTSIWICHKYTYVPSLLNLLPISLPD